MKRCLLILLCVLLLSPRALAGDRIRLRDTVYLAPGPVTLGQVADLQGDGALPLASLSVGQLQARQGSLTLTRESLVKLLDTQQVHWGHLELGGFAVCKVLVYQAPAETERMTPEAGNAPSSASADPATAAAGVAGDSPTVKDRVLAVLCGLSDLPAEQWQVSFNAPDASILATPLSAGRFELEPMATVLPGRVPVKIRQYREGRLIATQTITADVQRRVAVVVALRDLTRGQTLAAGDVEVRTVLLDTSRGTPADAVDAVAGQVMQSSLRAGQVVYEHMVQPPALVKTGQLITVRCLRGNLVVRMVMRAKQDGGQDQVITVSNEKSRQTMQARVVGPGEAVTIEQGPLESAAGSTDDRG